MNIELREVEFMKNEGETIRRLNAVEVELTGIMSDLYDKAKFRGKGARWANRIRGALVIIKNVRNHINKNGMM